MPPDIPVKVVARDAYGDRAFTEDTCEAEPGDSGTLPGPGDIGERRLGSPEAMGRSHVRESSVPSQHN